MSWCNREVRVVQVCLHTIAESFTPGRISPPEFVKKSGEVVGGYVVAAFDALIGGLIKYLNVGI